MIERKSVMSDFNDSSKKQGTFFSFDFKVSVLAIYVLAATVYYSIHSTRLVAHQHLLGRDAVSVLAKGWQDSLFSYALAIFLALLIAFDCFTIKGKE